MILGFNEKTYLYLSRKNKLDIQTTREENLRTFHGRPYLYAGSRKIDGCEGDSDGGVASLHVVDGVHKDKMSRHHQQHQHPGRARVHTYTMIHEGNGGVSVLWATTTCIVHGKQ